MKDKNEVIEEFNELVNMTVDELTEWLNSDASQGAGWQKDDGSGETIGHDSGRKIVDILSRNPNKQPDTYTEDDIAYMRKVVSYCKRHLAQESRLKDTKTPQELDQTKSTKSLRNWGHDPLKY